MQRTPVAVLGTLAEFHREPIPYDLRALVQLVTNLQPDLLCLDVTMEQWRSRSSGDLPPEYREALLPLAYQTDIVVVPIGGASPLATPVASAWRGRLIVSLRRWLAHLYRAAPSVAAVNSGPRHFIADLLYAAILLLYGRHTRQAARPHTAQLVRGALAAARRDPGATLLIVVTVQHGHHIRQALRRQPDAQLLPYSRLPGPVARR
jgi:hypothetical protein